VSRLRTTGALISGCALVASLFYKIEPSFNVAAMYARVSVARNVLLDGRLALFHKREQWLAVADLHFGFEISQRAVGNLFPFWGMETIEKRLVDLVRDYKPKHLVLLGDLVHDRSAASALISLLE